MTAADIALYEKLASMKAERETLSGQVRDLNLKIVECEEECKADGEFSVDTLFIVLGAVPRFVALVGADRFDFSVGSERIARLNSGFRPARCLPGGHMTATEEWRQLVAQIENKKEDRDAITTQIWALEAQLRKFQAEVGLHWLKSPIVRFELESVRVSGSGSEIPYVMLCFRIRSEEDPPLPLISYEEVGLRVTVRDNRSISGEFQMKIDALEFERAALLLGRSKFDFGRFRSGFSYLLPILEAPDEALTVHPPQAG